jgi:hypothetical protein
MYGRHFMVAAAILATVMPGVASAQNYYIPNGYPVMLTTQTDLSSRYNKAGERINFSVAENVGAKGQVLIPAGSIAVGEIVRSDRNGHVGKSGKITVRVMYIDTPQRRIALSGDRAVRGKSGTLPVVATFVFVSMLGSMFIHGTNAKIPAGTMVQAYLAEDLKFAATGNDTQQTASGYGMSSTGSR